MAKNTQKAASDTPRSLLRRVTDTCGKASDALDRCIERVSRMLDDERGDYDKDMASHLAWMTKNLAQIGGEVRKMEHHEAKLTDISPTVLLEYFRKQTPDVRAQWVRDISAMSEKRSVLG